MSLADPVRSVRGAVVEQEDRVETLSELVSDRHPDDVSLVAHHAEPGNAHAARFILTGGVTA